jgi:hypothetical protein
MSRGHRRLGAPHFLGMTYRTRATVAILAGCRRWRSGPVRSRLLPRAARPREKVLALAKHPTSGFEGRQHGFGPLADSPGLVFRNGLELAVP